MMFFDHRKEWPFMKFLTLRENYMDNVRLNPPPPPPMAYACIYFHMRSPDNARDTLKGSRYPTAGGGGDPAPGAGECFDQDRGPIFFGV